MERLTEWTGEEWIPALDRLNGKIVGYKDCMRRLAAYENLGLTSGEIKNLLDTGKYQIMDCTGCVHKGNRQFCLNCFRGGSRDYYLREAQP